MFTNRTSSSDETTRHPIERVMNVAFTKLKELVDTDTIIGSPMSTTDGTIVIPVSKVTMGFLTGGGEYDSNKNVPDFPFAGGSGGGLSVTPIGFLVGKNGVYSVVNMDKASAYAKLLELVPQMLSKAAEEEKQ